MFYIIKEDAKKIVAKCVFKSRKCEFLCEERMRKKRSKLAAPRIEPMTTEFMLMSCSGANEMQGRGLGLTLG